VLPGYLNAECGNPTSAGRILGYFQGRHKTHIEVFNTADYENKQGIRKV
jgi:hypothetical protein